MKNAEGRRPDPRGERLLVVDPAGEGAVSDWKMADLPRFLHAGDLLVVNDAASLPASLPVRVDRGMVGACEGLELRLAGAGGRTDEWWGVLFGKGSWREPTERRAPPPVLAVGDRLQVHHDLAARVEEVSPHSPRLLRLRFDRADEALYDVLYRCGRPVQYSYLREDLALWDVQTPYGARPWAMEMPSAGRPLTWDLLSILRRGGVAIARLTHAAGLSSTGDPALDARLPLPERYEIPEGTVNAIEAARRDGGRVVAVGTTVVRALEGSADANRGSPVAGEASTGLILDSGHELCIVDAILTGIHEPGTSHFALLQAFSPASLLDRGFRHAEVRGFEQHEFGDSMLVLGGGPARSRAA